MCEVFNSDGNPHPTNTRAKVIRLTQAALLCMSTAFVSLHLFSFCYQLREVIDAKVEAEEPWFGLEQEYTMLAKNTGRIYGWPENGYPAPQVQRCQCH